VLILAAIPLRVLRLAKPAKLILNTPTFCSNEALYSIVLVGTK
jgi:hypothetical protein